jgi:hypothetical protein
MISKKPLTLFAPKWDILMKQKAKKKIEKDMP